MVEIPASFIISSRLSLLDTKEILDILRLAQQRWKEKQVKKRMIDHKDTPLFAVGISNPQELTTVMEQDIPAIHIQFDCKALQAVQKREIRQQQFTNRLFMLMTSSLWGLYVYHLKYSHIFKKGTDSVQLRVFERGTIPFPNAMVVGLGAGFSICLGWVSQRLLSRQRKQYYCVENEKEFLLLRNDIIRSPCRFVVSNVLPYCLIGLSVFIYKTRIKS